MNRAVCAVLVLVLVAAAGPALAKKADDADVKELLANLKKPDPDDRRKAAEAICELCKDGDADFGGVIPMLIDALKDKDAIVRGEIAESLGFIGPDAKAAIPAVRALLKDPIPEVRSKAAFALGGFGEDAKAAVPDLVKLFKDKDERVRAEAAEVLGNIGPDSKDAVALTAALKDRNKDVRKNAAEAIKKIEGK